MKPSVSVDEMVTIHPYGWPQQEKRSHLRVLLSKLTKCHYDRCQAFRNIVDNVFGGIPGGDYETLEDLPFIPVSLFKTHKLASVPDDEIIKVLTSSGTTGQAVSRIHLDRVTAGLQGKVLVKIMQHFLGKDRLPMVILDHPGVVRNRKSYSARGAGILGMMQFGRKPHYALREDMSLDLSALRAYLDQNAGQNVLFFGFTYMVWQHFVRALEESNASLECQGATLIHSGGWKKLENARVSPEEFDERFRQCSGAARTLNFYGMVEQVGGIFMENPLHALHASIFSEIIVRDPKTLVPLDQGKRGLIQVLSVLPASYPGFSILTEDLGEIVGEDLEQHSMFGRYFRIHGRVAKSELRGCSDTYQLPETTLDESVAAIA